MQERSCRAIFRRLYFARKHPTVRTIDASTRNPRPYLGPSISCKAAGAPVRIWIFPLASRHARPGVPANPNDCIICALDANWASIAAGIEANGFNSLSLWALDRPDPNVLAWAAIWLRSWLSRRRAG